MDQFYNKKGKRGKRGVLTDSLRVAEMEGAT
jgi:hypothetical protein